MVDLASHPADAATRQVALSRAQDMAARYAAAGSQLDALQGGRPLYVVADGDIALTLGHLIHEDPRIGGGCTPPPAAPASREGGPIPAPDGERPRSEILVIDGITLWGFDYIDLGRIRMPSLTVPVTIKSLVFSEDPRSHGRSDPAQWHRHGDGTLHRHHHALHDDQGAPGRHQHGPLDAHDPDRAGGRPQAQEPAAP